MKSYSRTTLKDTSEGSPSQWAELEAVHIVVYVYIFGKRNDQMCDCFLLMGCSQWIGWMVRDLEMIEQLVIKTFREVVCG